MLVNKFDVEGTAIHVITRRTNHHNVKPLLTSGFERSARRVVSRDLAVRHDQLLAMPNRIAREDAPSLDSESLKCQRVGASGLVKSYIMGN